MSVDVVIPTYQETSRLFRAVRSALDQTSPVDQIYVIDDGSDYEVQESLRNHLSQDSRVTLIFNKHTGLPGVGRMDGIRLSSANWVAFLDADDFWEPTKIDKQLTLARDTGTQFVCTNGIKVKNGNQFGNYFPDGAVSQTISFSDLLRDNKVIASSVLAERSLLLDVGTFSSGHHVRAVEDYATWLRCSSITKISYLQLPLVYYEISEHGLSATLPLDASIFAISDFILWCRDSEILGERGAKKMRQAALKAVKSRFVKKPPETRQATGR